MSLNKCQFIGNATKDSDLRYTPQGNAVASVSIACDEKFKDRNGQMQEKTEFVNLVVWGKLAEIFGKYVTKGKQIWVEGKMQTRSYEDRDGNRKYITEIRVSEMLLLGGGGNGMDRGSQNDSRGNSRSERPTREEFTDPPFDPDSDIPF